MNQAPVIPLSLGPTIDRIVENLAKGHDTALIAPPGCGASTFLDHLLEKFANQRSLICRFVNHSQAEVTETIAAIKTFAADPSKIAPKVVILDNTAKLLPDDFKELLGVLQEQRRLAEFQCLWIGPLDSRAVYQDFGFRLHSVPKSHVSFPILLRDEILAIYRAIASANSCTWGEAILFLMLDFCGNDLSLVKGATEYFYGNWGERLYDQSVWDRLSEWLEQDATVEAYRQRLQNLPDKCQQYLKLFRLGGKPISSRMEFYEEVDDALRTFCLQGFLVHNFIPGFYQLRNLTVRMLIHEGLQPEIIFRRATNERVAQLLQDVESMLRSVLLSVFHTLGEERVRGYLVKRQSEQEFIPSDLNRELLQWAREQGVPDLRESLSELINRHRLSFKEKNSLWSRIEHLIRQEGLIDTDDQSSTYLRYVDYLTFGELGAAILDNVGEVFPGLTTQPDSKKQDLIARWREYISRVRRLRNQVAHLRNVSFQDVEDLVNVVGYMRKDLIAYAAWR
ncbi:hypothetical protein [Desulfobacca acetoxidans]|uniref:Uncharacterized protein n=1 Tax=Desulfobacca acetoxidans (strain ATCC 700848 / DSM 11109 / ASRB2) TaxID=880072 RepID=F2NH02_DESAR|nr:hypothetical protein [Desulfobacca acetoxidans]AEB08773.1 hypothetical protein Desac_0899 [Desulfobacca acetoxidans DSM 11109]